ncbi:breast cancer type 2 susceptibility protein homolog [Anopheles bellator]|uniref:breast cancer type 2 susceptibility protein homolog n=1 Tax=Anopheles bellator TaxID=139047 RepID=UPI0026497170|nr:breast cancer type 2 susceptibility protein homolog [Anopheles bellator]
MEEVPASPEVVKRKKRRKQASFKRLSLHEAQNNAPSTPEASCDPSPDENEESNPAPESSLDFPLVGGVRNANLLAFYFDDDTGDQFETVTGDPLAGALLLEKANAIRVSKVPSQDMDACTFGEFLSVAELARRDNGPAPQTVDADTVEVKKDNYSFTQLESYTQMVGILNALENDNQEPDLHDFSPDTHDTGEIDFSVINSKFVLQTVLQLQDHITSPPRPVRRQPTDRVYENVKRKLKARRLSYRSDESSGTGPQSVLDDESLGGSEISGVTNHFECDGERSLDGADALQHTSVHIQENLTQLSTFFSKVVDDGVSAPHEEAEANKKEKQSSKSIEHDPTFCGFTPDLSSQITLTTVGPASPMSFRYHSFDSFSNDEVTAPFDDDQELDDLAVPIPVTQLEEDYDLLMFDQPSDARRNGVPLLLESPEKVDPEEVTLQNRTLPEPPVHVGFITAGGSSITISNAALQKAKALFAEEEAKHEEDIKVAVEVDIKPKIEDLQASEKAVEGATERTPTTNSMPHFAGFSTAAGNAITISAKALERAKCFFADEEGQMDNPNMFLKTEPSDTGGGFSTAAGSTMSMPTNALHRGKRIFGEEEAKASGTIHETRFGGGFSTASGSKILVSEKALERARAIFSEVENECETVQGAPTFKHHGAFPTFKRASGTTITVSGRSLERAKQMWSDFDRENEPPDTPKANFRVKELHQLASDVKSGQLKPLAERVELRCSPRRAVDRKRKHSPDPETPTKTSKPNPIVMGQHTSTPAATLTSTAAAVHDVDQFFAALDDSDFHELFGNAETLPKTQTIPTVEGGNAKSNNKSVGGGDWDDSFPEMLLPKLLAEEPECGLPETVRSERLVALQKQREFVENKPDTLCRPVVSLFCAKKLQKNRIPLEQFVGHGTRPKGPSVVTPAMDVTVENSIDFRFNIIDFYGETVCNSNVTGVPIGSEGEACLLFGERSTVGLEEFKLAFLATPGVDPRLVPCGWVENAWRWIVSKLSALERNFGDRFAGVLTPDNVFQQLQYRYHREIDLSQRSSLRRMLEKDDIAIRRMVLFVSRVFTFVGGVGYGLELSDGWYAVLTTIDGPLTSAVTRGKITVGTKLMIQGAELTNHSEGCSPLEVPPEVRLKIHANATRRVRWMVKLGYYRHPKPFTIPCNSVLDGGGLVCRFRAMVVRLYPMVFVEKSTTEGQPSTLRSERMQLRHSKRNESGQLDILHKLYNQVQQEVEAERIARCSVNRNFRLMEGTSCEELQELLENGLDVSFLDIDLSSSQRTLIERFQQQRQEALQNEIQQRVKAQLDKRPPDRSSVTGLLKVRLMDPVKPEKVFLLSIWRPSEDTQNLLQEQSVVVFGNVTANGTKNGEVQLTTHKSTTYTRDPSSVRVECCPLQPWFRTITPIGSIDGQTFCPPFNEFDTVGIVVGMVESKKFQSIYLADTAMDLLCVNFWDGLAKYAYDDFIAEQKVLCVANLQWRTLNRLSTVPQSFATEYTTFTENPRSARFRTEWDRFQVQLNAIDREHFFKRCSEKVRELLDATMPPYGTTTPNNSNVSTPYLQRSLNRLEQTSTPVGVALGDNLTKRKLKTLSTIYASPPKTTPIMLRTNPILRKGFKTPARLEDRLNGANHEEGRQ